MLKSAPKPSFELTGGHLALDFVNTVNSRPTEHPEELFLRYTDFARWAYEAGALTTSEHQRLYTRGAHAPGRAASALQEAVKLREAIFSIFSAIADGRAVAEAALALVNFYVGDSERHRQVIHVGQHFEWRWREMDSYLMSPLWPVARAAADLLVSEDLGKVRRCASATCDWLFLDKSHNHLRRWCDMKTCGNRDKARRHYERIKSE